MGSSWRALHGTGPREDAPRQLGAELFHMSRLLCDQGQQLDRGPELCEVLNGGNAFSYGVDDVVQRAG
jgi:hypothetical protein